MSKKEGLCATAVTSAIDTRSEIARCTVLSDMPANSAIVDMEGNASSFLLE